MVMGPSIGVILGDLEAEVIKVETQGGDPTRRLLGSGAGHFPMFKPQQAEPLPRPEKRRFDRDREPTSALI